MQISEIGFELAFERVSKVDPISQDEENLASLTIHNFCDTKIT